MSAVDLLATVINFLSQYQFSIAIVSIITVLQAVKF